MKNPKIAEKLKEYRKINHLSVDEVAAYLREKNIDVATKTIYGWENGQTQPSADNLMHLCRFYNIQNVLAAFGYLPSGTELPSLSNQEYKLIEAYRNHHDMQPAIDKLLDLIRQRLQKSQRLKRMMQIMFIIVCHKF